MCKGQKAIHSYEIQTQGDWQFPYNLRAAEDTHQEQLLETRFRINCGTQADSEREAFSLQTNLVRLKLMCVLAPQSEGMWQLEQYNKSSIPSVAYRDAISSLMFSSSEVHSALLGALDGALQTHPLLEQEVPWVAGSKCCPLLSAKLPVRNLKTQQEHSFCL